MSLRRGSSRGADPTIVVQAAVAWPHPSVWLDCPLVLWYLISYSTKFLSLAARHVSYNGLIYC
jgi:hypothetical protein